MRLTFDSCSSLGNSFQIQLDIDPNFQSYWLDQNHKFAFYQILVKQVINQPYADIPDDKIRSNNTIIYHSNHDSAHAARQYTNLGFFLELVKSQGMEHYRQAVVELTLEEGELLHLAAFLLRAGRTNERSGAEDRSNQSRSAELFKAIALAVGFNEHLVQTIAYCVEYTYQSFEGREQQLVLAFAGEQQVEKLQLAKNCLHLSHHTDLVRCFPDKERIAEANKTNLKSMLENGSIDAISDIILEYARASCEVTGTPYFLHNNSPERVIPRRDLKAQAVEDIAKTISLLENAVKTPFLVIANQQQAEAAREQLAIIREAVRIKASPELTQAVTVLQRSFFARRSHSLTRKITRISPLDSSKNSLEKLKDELRAGHGLTPQEQEYTKVHLLLNEEKGLYDYLLNQFEWTIKHVTRSYPLIQADGNVLKSVDKRNVDSHNNTTSHTDTLSGKTDNVFGTLTGPNGPAADFLNQTEGYEIRIPLRPFLKKSQASDKLRGLWISSHWSNYLLSTQTEGIRSQIYDTERTIHYVSNHPGVVSGDNKKRYHYLRKDGRQFMREVAIADEVITGAELMPFLAFNIILELRLVGGTYRQVCLNDQTFKSIEPFIHVIYSSSNFEALLPSRIDLNDKRIEVKPFAPIKELEDPKVKLLSEAIFKDRDVNAAKKLIEEGVPFDLNLGEGLTFLAALLLKGYAHLIPLCNLLIEKGANTQLVYGDNTLLQHAVLKKLHAVVECMLKTGLIEKNDRQIKRLYRPEQLKQAIIIAVSQADKYMLDLFIQYGYEVNNFAADFLQFIVDKPELIAKDMIDYLNAKGFNPHHIEHATAEQKYGWLKTAIEKNNAQVLTWLLELGCYSSMEVINRQPSLLAVARQVCNNRAVELLKPLSENSLQPGEGSQLTNPAINNKKRSAYLLVESDKNILISKKRRTTSTNTSYYQTITAPVEALDNDYLNTVLLRMIGVRLESMEICPVVTVESEQISETVIRIKTKDDHLKPVPTVYQTAPQWIDKKEISRFKSDALIQTLCQNPGQLGLVLERQKDLIQAIKTKNMNQVKALLEKGVVDDNGKALFIACDTNQPDLPIIKLLIDHGYDINQTWPFNRESFTPLILAIIHHQPALIERLVREGADINQVDEAAVSPLMVAAALEQFDTVALLEKNGASLNHPANAAVLAYLSMKACSDKAFNYFIDRADRNATCQGYTALMIETVYHNMHRVEALLRKGVNTEIRDPVRKQKARDFANQSEQVIFQKYEKTDHSNSTAQYQDHTKEYLRITGALNAPDLQDRIAREYDLTIIDDHSVLLPFAQQLLGNAGAERFSRKSCLAIAHSGNAPVFTCHGFKQPIIAIHKQYLLQPDFDYNQLVFAVAHELIYIEQTNYQFRFCTAGELASFDQKASIVCANPDVIIEYMQKAPQVCKVYQSADNFNWHSACYGYSGHSRPDRFMFQERLKLFRTSLAQSSKKSNDSADLVRSGLSDETAGFIKSLKQYVYYSEFPDTGTIKDKYDYLIAQLPSLAYELIPFEKTGVPSSRLKEFCQLLNTLPESEEKLHRLLKQAHDLEISSFSYLYKSACGADQSVTKPILFPYGYFYTMYKAMLAFKQATTLEQAQSAHQVILATYPKIVNHGHCNFYNDRHYQPNFNFHNLDRFYSDIGQLIAWPAFNDAKEYERHLNWILCNEQAQAIQLWKSLWIMGVTKEVLLYQFISRDKLIQIPELWAGTYQASFDEVIPRPVGKSNYFSEAVFSIYPYFVDEKYSDINPLQLDCSMLQNGEIQDLALFIQINLPHFKSFGYHDSGNTPGALVLLTYLSNLAKGNKQQQGIVRQFFLSQDEFCFQKLVNSCEFDEDSIYTQFIIAYHYLFSSIEMEGLLDFFDINQQELLFKMLGFNNDSYKINLFNLINVFISKRSYVKAGPLFETHFNNSGVRSIFSDDTYQDLIFFFSSLDSAVFFCSKKSSFFSGIRWASIDECQLTIEQCINLYRILDQLLAFPNLQFRADFGHLILTRIQQISSFEDAFFYLASFLDKHKQLTPLQDRGLFKKLIDELVKRLVQHYSKDQGSVTYAYAIKNLLTQFHAGFHRTDVVYFFDRLADKIEAQHDICVHIENLLEPTVNQHQLKEQSTHYSYVLDAFKTFISNSQDKLEVLEFISSPFSEDSIQRFMNYVANHPRKAKFLDNFGFKDNDSLEDLYFPLTYIYNLFWDLRIQERAVVLDGVIITIEDEMDEDSRKNAYQEGFNNISNKLFPDADTDPEAGIALSLLSAYLHVANKYERQYLLAGLLVTSNECHETYSIGRKIATLCEHLGPAYIKLAQAIHSHPDTPLSMKQDLSHVKGRANPPHRWHLWRLIKTVLTNEQRQSIASIGRLLGSASYNLALELTTQTGEQQVLLLLRDNAREEAEKGFQQLAKTILHCQHPKVIEAKQSFLNIIQEAEAMSHCELDHLTGDEQHKRAHELYHHSLLEKKVAGRVFKVVFKTAESLSSGPGYRVLSRMPGVEYNDLPGNTAEEKAIRKAIALAVMEKELTLILSGGQYDCDRHGNQLRIIIEGNRIELGLYDFGEMSLQALSPLEIESLAALVKELPLFVKTGQSVNILFEKHINMALQTGHPTRHFVRMNKALLALQDFQKELSVDELKTIFYRIVPSINRTFAKSLLAGAYQHMSFREMAGTFFQGMQETVDDARRVFTNFWMS
ncbi:SidE phosphodiesterase domain-containing protein [Legionella sp. 16cNR16C]|uniref:SidE phosphodiesterase domain-containing protein n=1 Tax=Legionella sp. 16cNR16C TaxID=2905656 RepID=UPI001E58DC93|nr:SidE phosphodiesterase domain-containing protein [Legionella sp. 16cNR16C]MCE3045215.1 SidE phosphodiesterase domain-containing protein [Legionella sp. 16cNR16C]